MLFKLQFKHQWGPFHLRVKNSWLKDIIITTEQAPKSMETASFAKQQINYYVDISGSLLYHKQRAVSIGRHLNRLGLSLNTVVALSQV